MAKRMILMLALTAAVLAGLGMVKFQQLQTAAVQAAAFRRRRSGDDHRRHADEWPDTGCIGTTPPSRRPRCGGPAGLVRGSRSSRDRRHRATCSSRSTPAGAGAAVRRRSLAIWPLNFARSRRSSSTAPSRGRLRSGRPRKVDRARVGDIKARLARRRSGPFSGISSPGGQPGNTWGAPVVPLQSLHRSFDSLPQQETSRVHFGLTVLITATSSPAWLLGRVTPSNRYQPNPQRPVSPRAEPGWS